MLFPIKFFILAWCVIISITSQITSVFKSTLKILYFYDEDKSWCSKYHCVANANNHLYILVLILQQLVIDCLSCKPLFLWFLTDFFCYLQQTLSLKWSYYLHIGFRFDYSIKYCGISTRYSCVFSCVLKVEDASWLNWN